MEVDTTCTAEQPLVLDFDQMEMPATPRIYVSSNLMIEETVKPIKKSGRRKGAKKVSSMNNQTFTFKCPHNSCGCRFSTQKLLEYHQKCHTTESDDIQCPECLEPNNFKNWIRLHSHLWLHHSIDMDLFKCELCNYR